jgi:hypothetical protein
MVRRPAGGDRANPTLESDNLKNRTLISAAMMAGLALAGCGGSSAPSLSTFKSGFSADKKQFTKLGTDLAASITGANKKTDDQLATELTALATRAKQEAGQLSKLNPPSKYKSQLGDLESGFKAVSADLTSISAAATKHNSATAGAATRKLIQDAGKVKSADTALSKGLGVPTTS